MNKPYKTRIAAKKGAINYISDMCTGYAYVVERQNHFCVYVPGKTEEILLKRFTYSNPK